jgi:alpha-D-xyloside xylohydrolase
VYKRWLAFGLLSSHSRLHGNSSYRVPWVFDEEAVEVLRHFTKLKCRLMPYLYASAKQAATAGTPMMRAMLLEFPDDPACEYLDRQYMLGDSLLVAPVFNGEGDVQYYVPAGRWTELATGKVIEGPRWVNEQHGFMSLPLLVRPNTVLAMGSNDQRPDYDYADGVTLQIYELADGASVSVSVPTLKGEAGATFEVRRSGNAITVEAKGTDKPWEVVLVGGEMGVVVKSKGNKVQTTWR